MPDTEHDDAEFDAHWQQFAAGEMPDRLEADLVEPVNGMLVGTAAVAIVARGLAVITSLFLFSPTFGPLVVVAARFAGPIDPWLALDYLIFGAAVVTAVVLAIAARPDRRQWSYLTYWLALAATIDGYAYGVLYVIGALSVAAVALSRLSLGVMTYGLVVAVIVGGLNMILATMCHTIARRTRHARTG